ncbi:MAG TPA: HepT-like ribonuclease domain-containing protein [Candidatus Methylomirabilis sp.]|nr:HepT-like ribonuclease domain-containing protein [Candidatus Methylomirabilis sp.]
MLLVKDILQNMRDAEEFIQGFSYDEFASDKKTFNAVVGALEVMGEAAKNVPAVVRRKYPLCPGGKWQECGTR